MFIVIIEMLKGIYSTEMLFERINVTPIMSEIKEGSPLSIANFFQFQVAFFFFNATIRRNMLNIAMPKNKNR